MNMLNKDFKTKEDGMEALKKGVSLRNQMGGALYWNILNDDCVEIADKLLTMGVSHSEISAVLG